MDDFFTNVYPKIWQEAYDLGGKAWEDGLPRNCNLSGRPFVTPSGVVLKVYKSAWEQGWDNYRIPDEFRQMEDYLNGLPLRSLAENDL